MLDVAAVYADGEEQTALQGPDVSNTTFTSSVIPPSAATTLWTQLDIRCSARAIALCDSPRRQRCHSSFFSAQDIRDRHTRFISPPLMYRVASTY